MNKQNIIFDVDNIQEGVSMGKANVCDVLKEDTLENLEYSHTEGQNFDH